jgi:hypothetical protein
VQVKHPAAQIRKEILVMRAALQEILQLGAVQVVQTLALGKQADQAVAVVALPWVVSQADQEQVVKVLLAALGIKQVDVVAVVAVVEQLDQTQLQTLAVQVETEQHHSAVGVVQHQLEKM